MSPLEFTQRLAFSCKRRGFCPSCGARRMSQTAAHLVDHVIPHVPVRQWVLSLPIPLRVLLAAQPELVTPVLQVVQRAVTRHLAWRGTGWRHGQRLQRTLRLGLGTLAQTRRPVAHAQCHGRSGLRRPQFPARVLRRRCGRCGTLPRGSTPAATAPVQAPHRHASGGRCDGASVARLACACRRALAAIARRRVRQSDRSPARRRHAMDRRRGPRLHVALSRARSDAAEFDRHNTIPIANRGPPEPARISTDVPCRKLHSQRGAVSPAAVRRHPSIRTRGRQRYRAGARAHPALPETDAGRVLSKRSSHRRWRRCHR